MDKHRKSKANKLKVKGKSEPSGMLVRFMVPLSIVVFTFILYGNTLNHSYALDDDMFTRQNEFVSQGFHGIPAIFSKGFLYGFNKHNDQSYRPVSLLTLAVEVGIFGENPESHHLFNVLYYALACILFFFVLKRIFLKYPIIVPILMVLVFIAHPVHTEDVANFKSRDEVLNFLFLQCLLLTLFRFVDTNKKGYIFLSLLFFFLALLTKEQAITFLALVPLFIYFFSTLPWKRILYILVPFIAVAGIYLLIRWSILDAITFGEKMTILNNGLMAANNAYDRLATAIFILGKYLLLLFFPHPLSYDYSYNQIPIVSFSNPWVILTIIIFSAWGLYAIIRFRAKEIYSFSFFFFIFTMSVVSNIFIFIGSTLGERFLLIPSMAFCMCIIFLTGMVTRTDLQKITVKKIGLFLGVVVIILCLYSYKTIRRNLDWRNNLTLFEADIKTVPNSTKAQGSLGCEYLALVQSSSDPAEKQQYYEKGKTCFQKSLEICPVNTHSLYNFGVLELTSGNFPEAEILCRKTVLLDPRDYNAWNNLCFLSVKLEQYDSAILYMKKLLEFTPDDDVIAGNIGAIYQRKNEYANAIGYLKRALAINPGRAVTYDNLILIYENQGDTTNVRYYKEQKAQYIR